MARTQVRGEQILDQSVSLTADVKDTLAIANGGTGSTSASTARTALGAQALISPSAATVATSESTSSTSYVDLTTTTDTVTVTIGSSGVALVVINAVVSSSGFAAHASYAISGASTAAAADSKANAFTNQVGAALTSPISLTYLETGLTAGSTTFKMKYRTTGGTPSFANRRIAVIPL